MALQSNSGTIPIDTTGRAIEKLVAKLDAWLESAILMLPNLVLAILVLIAFWIVAKVGRRIALRIFEHGLPGPAARVLATLVYILVLVLGTFVALGVVGLDKTLTSVLAGAGIVGLALAFAFQDIAANFFAGVFISFRRPFRLGDIIETNGYLGTVEQIDLRSTTLQTRQGQMVLIPNRLVFENPIVNFTSSGRRRVDLEVGVSYGDDLARASEVALDAVADLPHLGANPNTRLFYTGFGDSSINFVLQFWVDYDSHATYLAAQSEAIQAIKSAFDANDITIPFPIRTLDFGIVGGEGLSEHLGRTGKASSPKPE